MLPPQTLRESARTLPTHQQPGCAFHTTMHQRRERRLRFSAHHCADPSLKPAICVLGDITLHATRARHPLVLFVLVIMTGRTRGQEAYVTGPSRYGTQRHTIRKLHAEGGISRVLKYVGPVMLERPRTSENEAKMARGPNEPASVTWHARVAKSIATMPMTMAITIVGEGKRHMKAATGSPSAQRTTDALQYWSAGVLQGWHARGLSRRKPMRRIFASCRRWLAQRAPFARRAVLAGVATSADAPSDCCEEATRALADHRKFLFLCRQVQWEPAQGIWLKPSSMRAV